MRILGMIGAVALAGLAQTAEAQPAPSPPPQANVVTRPGWLRKPSGEDIGRFYPAKAQASLMSGSATMSCGVLRDGSLDRCTIVSEFPPEYGFGEAAVRMSPLFRMSPKTPDGKSVEGGTVRIPIFFKVPGGQSMARLVVNPPWRSTPTPGQVAAAFPKEASGVATGSAVVRCGFEASGAATACQVRSQSPSGKGFGAAAKKLAASFVILPLDALPNPLFVVADIPFTFHNPAMPQESPRLEPQWVRTLTAAGAEKLFPPAARAANLTTGLGVVSCAAGPAGQLVDCQLQREDPVGMGFGAASLEAAKLMAMNPWTEAGEPMEGRRLTLPIRLRVEGPAPTPPAQP